MLTNNIGIFNGRESFITFSEYLPAATQDWLAIARRSEEMARTQQSVVTNITHLPHIGKQITPLHLDAGSVAWLTAAQTGIISNPANGATVAPNFKQLNTFAQQTISGITYSGNVQTIGTSYNVHQPPAGTNWSSDVLAGDQSGFPSPNTAEDFTPMYRVLNCGSGAAGVADDLVFNLLIPTNAITPRGSIATLYFNGPAGDSAYANNPSTAANQPAPSNTGSGQYALKLRGDKRAYLYELAQDNQTYLSRFSFNWDNSSSSLSWTLVSITVCKRMWKDSNNNWRGDTITFLQKSGAISQGQLSGITNNAELSSITQRFQNGLTPCYNVPRLTTQPITTCPVRMDIASDCRVSFNVSRHTYLPTGSITDDVISFNRPITNQRLLTVTWNGTLNGGSQWDAQLYDQNGTACTAVTSTVTTITNNGPTAYRYFTPTTGMTGGFVKFTLTASADTFSSPLIVSYNIFGPPLYNLDNPVTPITIPYRVTPTTSHPSLWAQTIESVDIHYQDSDPSAENATIVINDLTGALDSLLEVVNLIPIHVWCTDPSTISNPNSQTITLFRGYVLVAQGERMRTDVGQVYPNQLWTQWTLQCVGEWSRLQDATLPIRQIWQDEESNTNAKVTDAVTNMLQSVYPPSMVQVSESSIRLFGTEPSTWTGEPGTRIGDLCQDWMRDYFGGYCLFDGSAGALGMWRAIFQKLPPYNNLAIFEIDHPTILFGDSIPRVPQLSSAYGTTTSSSGQLIQHTFIKDGSFKPHVERAEGNCVVVFGGGSNDDAQEATGSDATCFSSFAINVKSYNFLNLTPSEAGYPDGTDSSYFGRLIPIRVFRYDLPNQQAVDFYCRRIFDRSCFARYFISFEAPLLFVNDNTDPYQVRPRPLRYYDAVQLRQYDGSLMQFLVVSCEASYTKDQIQMARYTIVTQENINQRAIVPPAKSGLQALKKAQSRIIGNDLANASAVWSANKQATHINTAIMALPNPTGLPLQNLNNTSSTFGEFYITTDYTSVPGQDLVR